MYRSTHRPRVSFGRGLLAAALFITALAIAAPASAQSDHFKNSDAPRLTPHVRVYTPEQQARVDAGKKEQERELAVLGIKALRPDRNAFDPDAPNAANYDEALANPYPHPSEVLRMNGGAIATTPAQWWKERRPEIVEALEREVYGRLPANVPGVTWRLASTTCNWQ